MAFKNWFKSTHDSKQFSGIWFKSTHDSNGFPEFWFKLTHDSRSFPEVWFKSTHDSKSFPEFWGWANNVDCAVMTIPMEKNDHVHWCHGIWCCLLSIKITLSPGKTDNYWEQSWAIVSISDWWQSAVTIQFDISTILTNEKWHSITGQYWHHNCFTISPIFLTNCQWLPVAMHLHR